MGLTLHQLEKAELGKTKVDRMNKNSEDERDSKNTDKKQAHTKIVATSYRLWPVIQCHKGLLLTTRSRGIQPPFE